MSVFSRGERFWLIGLSVIIGISVFVRFAYTLSGHRLMTQDSAYAAAIGVDSNSESIPKASMSADDWPSDANITDETTAPQSTSEDSHDVPPETTVFPIDINRATEDLFVRLPGIGPVIAGRIVAYRDAHGPFRRVDQLKLVQGIGDARMAQLRPLVIVDTELDETSPTFSGDRGINDQQEPSGQASD